MEALFRNGNVVVRAQRLRDGYQDRTGTVYRPGDWLISCGDLGDWECEYMRDVEFRAQYEPAGYEAERLWRWRVPKPAA